MQIFLLSVNGQFRVNINYVTAEGHKSFLIQTLKENFIRNLLSKTTAFKKENQNWISNELLSHRVVVRVPN